MIHGDFKSDTQLKLLDMGFFFCWTHKQTIYQFTPHILKEKSTYMPFEWKRLFLIRFSYKGYVAAEMLRIKKNI